MDDVVVTDIETDNEESKNDKYNQYLSLVKN